MNWQKISIERLKEYEARKTALQLLPEQIETLEAKYTAIRSAQTDATPIRGNGGNKREDALINNIVMRDELKQNLKIAEREIAVTEKGLAGLTDEQKRILDGFYINRGNGHVESLCVELHLEKSRIYALKDEALKKFTLSCYGVVNI